MFLMEIGLQMVAFRAWMGLIGEFWQTVWSFWKPERSPFPRRFMNENMVLVQCGCSGKPWSLRTNFQDR